MTVSSITMGTRGRRDAIQRAFAGPRDLQALVLTAIPLACELFPADRRPAIKSLVPNFPDALRSHDGSYSMSTPRLRGTDCMARQGDVRTKPYKALERLTSNVGLRRVVSTG